MAKASDPVAAVRSLMFSSIRFFTMGPGEREGMEEKKSYGVVMLFVGVFVVFWSASCRTACGAISRLMRGHQPGLGYSV
jgi:hypothetical protein